MKLKLGVAAAAAAVLTAASVVPALSQPVPNYTGRPVVRDGDSLRFGDWVVFLWGIESVERGQVCFIDGQPWGCYAAAVRSLETITGVAEVVCEVFGEPDYLQRRLARCTVAGQDIAAAQVRAGFALNKYNETTEYSDEEAEAQREGIGLWQGNFLPPAEFRAAEGMTMDRL